MLIDAANPVWALNVNIHDAVHGHTLCLVQLHDAVVTVAGDDGFGTRPGCKAMVLVEGKLREVRLLAGLGQGLAAKPGLEASDATIAAKARGYAVDASPSVLVDAEEFGSEGL